MGHHMVSSRRFWKFIRTDVKTPLTLVFLRTGGALAAFAISLIMARTMDQTDMGIALTCMSVAPLVSVLITGSTEAGCVRFIVAYIQSNAIEKARGMVQFNRQVAKTLTLLLLFGFIGWLVLFARSANDTTALIALTAITASLLGWMRLGAAHALALGHVVRSIAPFSFLRQLFLLIGLVIWSITGTTLSATQVVLVMMFSTAIALLTQSGLNQRPMQQLGSGISDDSDRGEWGKVGLQLGLTLLFVQFSRDLFLLVSAVSLSPAEVAVLGIATAIVAFAKFGVVAVNQSITPRLSKAIARSDTQAFIREVRLSNHLKFWPMVMVFIVFVVFGDRIAAIFGPNFSAMTPILLILMTEPIALAFFGPGGQYLSLSGHQSVLLQLSLVTLLVLVVAVTLGARIDGLRGAAIGSSLTWTFWCASLALLTHRYAREDVTLMASLRRLVGKRQHA